MNQRNLLPARRISSNRQRRAAARWLSINGAYAMALVVVGLAYVCSGPPASAIASPALQNSANVDIAELNTTLALRRQQAMVLSGNLSSVLEVTDTPDWSHLLVRIAHETGDDVVLSSVEIAPDAARPTGGAPQRVTLVGIGRSQATVSAFVLRLEAMGFFNKVALTQTSAQPRHGSDSVGFRIACGLPEGNR